MGSKFIVSPYPMGRDIPQVFQTPKQIEIEHFIPIRAIKPLDKGNLRGAAGLNVVNQHAIGLSLVLQALREELWTVIQPDHTQYLS